MAHHQDFTPIVFGNNKNIKNKSSTIIYDELNRIKKIEDNERDDFKHKLIDKTISTKIITARCLKKLNRKQLSIQCNIKEQELSDIETGKSLSNNPNINKILRFLRIK